MVLTSKIFDLFKSSYKKVSKYFDINLLWTHSLGCAVISRQLSRKIRHPDPESLFIAGLIHDIGKVVEMSFNTTCGRVGNSSRLTNSLIIFRCTFSSIEKSCNRYYKKTAR